MAMLFTGMTAIQGVSEDKTTKDGDGLHLVCTPELENLAGLLADNYKSTEDGVSITVTAISTQELSAKLEGGSIALLNKACVKGLEETSYFKMVVGRDALVPVISANHPQKDQILQQGMTAEALAGIFTADEGSRVKAYLSGSECAMVYLEEFLQLASGKITATEMASPEKMLAQIVADPGAIGFCSLAYLMKLEAEGQDAGIILLPIDMNGNGSLDFFEDIYKSAASLSHGIYVGKFPRALYSRVYAVSAATDLDKEETAFLHWMMDGGQQTLASAGIMELAYGERVSGIKNLTGNEEAISTVALKASPARVFLVIAIFLFGLGFLTWIVARLSGSRSVSLQAVPATAGGPRAYPEGLFFDKSHTWAFMEKSGQVRIGIDHFLQNVTGPLTRVVMKEQGEKIKRGDSFLTLIQNGKRLEIKSPVTGVVETQNDSLLDDASLLNSDPYAEGWVLLVKPVSWLSELKSLLMGAPYGEWLKEELGRLKSFFASATKMQEQGQTVVLMQDGGEINDAVLQACGPEVWEEFQTSFIDTSK